MDNKGKPYSEDIKTVFTPRKYMTDDQRFAARRPDVLVYETEILKVAYPKDNSFFILPLSPINPKYNIPQL